MKDGGVRVIRPSAWRKRAMCVLRRWGGGAVLRDATGAGGGRAEKDGA